MLSSPARTNRLPRPPPLPFELWSEIISQLDDDAYLARAWYSCRRVSRLLRAATEEAFLHTALTKTHIRLGCWRPKGLHEKIEFLFVFDRLDPNDRSRAIFRDTRPTEEQAEFPSWGYAKLCGDVNAGAGGGTQFVEFSISLGRLENDTSLPHMEMGNSEEQVEISFDWLRMLNDFFGEDILASNLRNKWARENMLRALDIGLKVEAGSVDAAKAKCQTNRMVHNMVHETCYAARQKRLERWWDEHCADGSVDQMKDFHDYSMMIGRIETLIHFPETVEGSESEDQEDLRTWQRTARGEILQFPEPARIAPTRPLLRGSL